MDLIAYQDDHYLTPTQKTNGLERMIPTAVFYSKFCANVFRSSRTAKRGKYDPLEWSRSSFQVMQALEAVGVRFEIEGIEHVRRLKTPCVFVGNHMSMLETIVLPAIIQPIRNVTFVLKQSLLDYPFFGHIVRSRDPIAVTRDNPRSDFKTVMTEGVKRLESGISIVVFPQTTRASTFDPAQFNTIGVKLASRAGVPVIPLALRTDAWGNGKLIKDLGPIDSSKTVRFAFGPALDLQGRGDQQHQEVIRFIQSKLEQWDATFA
ncbi:1-acyl-sn-glycerol-3-phosphate acyltransferase [Stieleria sp. TO1_6]|uniref:lysophospholipid acyltransferase family protein n=1 Tax=Stieleria tagensis TaxID=2956795 RepID=UPI00209AB0DE|nr:lysophospholipid acyltransferase family protein [Stieleria tagensis]MCO8123107.1 1-acyl-sn-glycerol-3-phosphate acyltransferase [Stieleria tagensis]